MQRVFRRHVERVMRLAGDDRLGERVAQAPAAGIPADILLDIDHAVQRIVDAVIAGAAAEIAFQHARQIFRAFASKVAAVMIMPAAQKPH